jgi:hypothetical protein
MRPFLERPSVCWTLFHVDILLSLTQFEQVPFRRALSFRSSAIKDLLLVLFAQFHPNSLELPRYCPLKFCPREVMIARQMPTSSWTTAQKLPGTFKYENKRNRSILCIFSEKF